MAIARIRCTRCQTPISLHCPESNVTCTWLACLNPACTVRYLDTDRGLVTYTDWHTETWGEQPTSSEPPTIAIIGERGPEWLPPLTDEDDGRPATPDA